MSILNFGKKKESPCCCGCGAASNTEETANTCGCEAKGRVSSVKVLGAGCKSCHALYENTKQAAKALGLSREPEYITDMQKIMEYGVMTMPALVVNEKVVSQGKILKPAEIEKLLK